MGLYVKGGKEIIKKARANLKKYKANIRENTTSYTLLQGNEKMLVYTTVNYVAENGFLNLYVEYAENVSLDAVEEFMNFFVELANAKDQACIIIHGNFPSNFAPVFEKFFYKFDHNAYWYLQKDHHAFKEMTDALNKAFNSIKQIESSFSFYTNTDCVYKKVTCSFYYLGTNETFIISLTGNNFLLKIPSLNFETELENLTSLESTLIAQFEKLYKRIRLNALYNPPKVKFRSFCSWAGIYNEELQDMIYQDINSRHDWEEIERYFGGLNQESALRIASRYGNNFLVFILDRYFVIRADEKTFTSFYENELKTAVKNFEELVLKENLFPNDFEALKNIS